MDPGRPQAWFSRALMEGGRKTVLARAAAVTLAIALVDWHFEVNVSFGFLYLFPMLMAGAHLSRAQIAAAAALCTALSEAFDAYPWTAQSGIARLVLTFAAFFGAGLFVYESARNRRLAALHVEQLEREAELRREADEQLRILIESSPAAIFTLDAGRRVVLSNEAAGRLLGVEDRALEGQPIAPFLPALAKVPLGGETPLFRTAMECRGRRRDGEVFQAQIWFSTYRTSDGPRLAAVVFDSSEELRDREEFSLQQLLAGSKLVVGTVCHEIRNICGAIGMVHTKLAQDERLSGSEDFRALGGLVEGLGTMAGLELRQTRREQAEDVDVLEVLEQLRIVIDPAFRDSGIAMRWELPDSAPPVWAQRQALLQAFLNLAKNSQRAMEQSGKKELAICVVRENPSLVVRFVDSGHGVAAPARLFQPFQSGAGATGLGLFLSRAFLRSFHGDLLYEPRSSGCCFAVVLPLAPGAEEKN